MWNNLIFSLTCSYFLWVQTSQQERWTDLPDLIAILISNPLLVSAIPLDPLSVLTSGLSAWGLLLCLCCQCQLPTETMTSSSCLSFPATIYVINIPELHKLCVMTFHLPPETLSPSSINIADNSMFLNSYPLSCYNCL